MPPSSQFPLVLSSTTACTRQICRAAPQSARAFSTTSRHDQRVTRARRGFWQWLTTQGENFRNPLKGSTNYLAAYNKDGLLKRVVEANRLKEARKAEQGQPEPETPEPGKETEEIPPETARDRRPFPLNRHFVSEAVLSEELKDEIWSRVMEQGKSVREVSVELKVEMSRVGAVVRLKEIEKEWKRIGKPLARPYAKAVMAMLPKTEYDPTDPKARFVIHESINDLPVHASTGQQIFHPTSESRHFTRADAAKVFNKNLLPADDRIPHPELVIQHRERMGGLNKEEVMENARLRAEAAEEKRAQREAKQAEREAKIKKVESGRWEFRFTPINADDAGKDGRGSRGVGWRYGVPLYDRSKGQVKIPKSVA